MPESNISNPSTTAAILDQYKIKLNKNLGQNFLIDTNILRKIVKTSGVCSTDNILEIGSGIGSLTELLLKESAGVICIEIDKKLVNVFENLFADSFYRLKLIQSDAMHLDYSDICDKYKITKAVSNLPYKISAPLIIKILLEAPQIKEMYFTIQKDIADRILAVPGQKNYSSYSVKTKFLADCRVMFNIPRSCFMPAPFVDSVFIRVVAKKPDLPALSKKYAAMDTGLNITDLIKSSGDIICSPDFLGEYFSFVDMCFAHRRKKLLNSLRESKNRIIIDKINLIIRILLCFGKNQDIRAEELAAEEIFILFLKIRQDS
jgi:16S rRNA (adenine1518-N6/adenine1519-N6)-dimethyltransferase